MAKAPKDPLDKAKEWISRHQIRQTAKLMQLLVDELEVWRSGGTREKFLGRICPLCGSLKVVDFTDEDDICQECGKYFPKE